MIKYCIMSKYVLLCYTTLPRAVMLGWRCEWYMPCQPAGHMFYVRRIVMSVSYKKLWKILIDRDMKKKDLCAKAGISMATVTKMGKGGHVTTEILANICTAFDCNVDDIMEFVVKKEEE